MENKIIVGNMKMYMNKDEIIKYIEILKNNIKNNVILCPSSIYIPYFEDKNINIGIQNIYFEDNGPYTGEISVEQIKNMNIKYAIVGHSERRNIFKETDYDINKKLIKVLENNLNVILCIGETLISRNEEKTNIILREQIEIALNNISSKYEKNILIAYEPIWAIGTGIIPGLEEINKTVDYIKSVIFEKYKMKIKVLYGGSVNENNINSLNKISNLDGFMVGGACTKPEKMLKIIDSVNSIDKTI